MTKIAMRFVTTTDIPIGDALVAIRLTRSDYEEKTSGVLMPRLEEFHTDADGFLQVDLTPATHLYHVTVYDTVQDIAIHHDFIVPEVEDPNTVLLLPDLIVPPDTVLSSLPYDEEALAKIIQAKIESVAAALQSQASAATAASSAATAVAVIDTVKADADKVEAWTATVDQQHTEVGAWTIQVAQNKTAVDAAVIEVNQDKDEAVNAAAGAKTSETNAANSAAAARTDSLSATASKTAAAASATAAAGSQTAAANSATAALASQTSATQSATTATSAATTATTAKNDALTYKDQAFQYMTSAQAAKGSAEGSAAAALASANSATASATTATGAATTSTAARDVAVDAKNKAETAWTDFDKRYFGAFAANPTVNAHGAAPTVGSLYWNTVTKTLFVWTGTAWYELTLAYRTTQNKKIVVLGSSVALGQGGTNYNGWASRLAVALTPSGFTMVNKSIGGNKTGDCIGRFYQDVVPENPSIVIIGLSIGNEGIVGSGDKVGVYNSYINGIRRLVAMCREMGYKVIVTGVYANNGYTADDYKFAMQANQELENDDYPYINFLGAVDDGAGKWRAGLFSDALHPNDAGHELMFRAFPITMFTKMTSDMVYQPKAPNKYGLKLESTPIGAAPLIYYAESPFGSFTVMFSVRRLPNATAGRPLMCLESSAGAWDSIRVRNSTDVLELATNTNLIVSSVATSAGASNVVTVTYDDVTAKWTMYINGTLIGSAIYAPAQTVNYDRITFGGRTDSAGFQSEGYEFGDLAVWRSALNPEQVAESYRGILSKASLCLYAPAIDSATPKNFRLTNLALSNSYVAVSSDGVVATFTNPTASDVATPYALVKTQANGLINNALLDTTEVVRPLAPVRTQANGYIKPGLLDPTQTIYTDTPLAVKAVGKYGCTLLHAGQVQLLYKIATLPVSGIGTYASLRIDAMLGSWGATTLTEMSVVMGSRDAFFVDWSVSRYVPDGVKFVVFQEADGSHSVYLMFNNSVFAQASFNLQGMGCQSYASPVGVNTVTGTVIWDSSAPLGVGGYIAPRLRGISGANNRGLQVNHMLAVGDGSITTSFLSGGGLAAAGQELDSLRLGVSGVSGVSYPGCFSWFTSGGNSNGTPNNLYKTSYRMVLRAYDTESNAWSGDLITVKGTGAVTAPALIVPTLLEVGVVNTEAQGARKLSVYNCFESYVVSGTYGNDAGSALKVATHSVTGSSIRTGGTVNTSGNDYAEYIFKCSACGIVTPGQIVGITDDNKVTDKWADAVMFSIKSTAPSFVGGDTWANDVGPRPSPQAGVAPVKPARRADVVTQQAVPGTNPLEFEDVVTEPGDTNKEWEAKMATYTASVAEWEQAVEADRVAMEEFDAKLEEARARVDRIAIAGRVPVNVIGAQPGDYIVPVQDGEGIKGIAVKEDDMTLRLYLRAVGQVITIEEDGRAYVMVKSV